MKKTKSIIVIAVGIALIILSVSLFMNKEIKPDDKIMTKMTGDITWQKKYGKEFNDNKFKVEDEELKNISAEGANETLSIAIPESSTLEDSRGNETEYSADFIRTVITRGIVDSGTDLTKTIYEEYKENSKDIVVYEYKNGNNIYVFEQASRNDETLPYEENLIIYNISKSQYVKIRYELFNLKFSDKLIENLIKKFSTNRENKTDYSCNESSGKYTCNVQYSEYYTYESSVDSSKYLYDKDNSSTFPLIFNNKENDENKKIRISINLVQRDTEELEELIDKYIESSEDVKVQGKKKVTINGKEFIEYSYKKYETFYKEYICSDGGIYTIRISISSNESSIDNVINDFSNYKIIKTNK